MNKNRLWLLAVLAPLALITAVLVARAQNDSPLKPPKGAKLALVVFEDLECPDCARANPLLEEAARTYKIPLVRYDFPLPMHPWAFDAALYARFFDSRKLGNQFRDEVFKHQQEITKDNLRAFADKFAKEHKISLPFAVDPQGKLAAEIKADQALGQRVGLSHTPTIYVVTNKTTGTPFVEVVDRNQLYQMIDALKAEAE